MFKLFKNKKSRDTLDAEEINSKTKNEIIDNLIDINTEQQQELTEIPKQKRTWSSGLKTINIKDVYSNIGVSGEGSKKSTFHQAAKLNLFLLSALTATTFSISGLIYFSTENIKDTAFDVKKNLMSLSQQLDELRDTRRDFKSKDSEAISSFKSDKNNVESIILNIERNPKFNNDVFKQSLGRFKETWIKSSNFAVAVLEKKAIVYSANQNIELAKKNKDKLLNDSEKLASEIKNINKSIANMEFSHKLSSNVYALITEVISFNLETMPKEKSTLINKYIKNIKEQIKIINETYVGTQSIVETNKSFETSFDEVFNEKVFADLEGASEEIYINLKGLDTELSNLKNIILNLNKTLEMTTDTTFFGVEYEYIALLSFLIGLISLMFISMSLYARSALSLELANEFKKNQSNEDALKELLQQMFPIDNGDFTKDIYIEDKFLSSLAKKINKTRIQFGDIVHKMQSSSANILTAANTTDKSSQEVLALSRKQFEKLSESIDIINEVNNSIDEIAQSAWIAKDEALRSSSSSEAGKELVQKSIEKMSEIRDNIQDSSKKIKKLGESAQSISEVTNLIKNITKQINILSLNAAIQAASSGESGREFTVVAHEVQRLAYDSEEATKKIEELIGVIQSDAATAIASMEITTQEVVSGSKLTEQAGVALNEISKSSTQTSEQITLASEKLEEKSSEMAQITFEMQGLQEISKIAQQALDIQATQVEKLKLISVEFEETFKKYKV